MGNGLVAPALDAQYAELIAAVWACQRAWALDNRTAAAAASHAQPSLTNRPAEGVDSR